MEADHRRLRRLKRPAPGNILGPALRLERCGTARRFSPVAGKRRQERDKIGNSEATLPHYCANLLKNDGISASRIQQNRSLGS